MCGGVSDLEFLAVRRAEGADVCHSFLVRLDRRGRVCQRNRQEVHVKGRSIALLSGLQHTSAIDKSIAIFIAINERNIVKGGGKIKGRGGGDSG
jgi:hypothetical protein